MTDSSPAESPAQRTRRVLPKRLGRTSRVFRAIGAMTRPSRSRGTRSNGSELPTPSELTLPTTPTMSERARSSWRQTDYLWRLDQAIAAPRLVRCATIAVISPKGGVGKTTISALLGTLLALVRRDRVVAIDTNPDFGSLGRTLVPTHDVFVDDMLGILDDMSLTVTELDRTLGRGAHGLMVLPAPGELDRMERLGEVEYTRVIQRLQDLVGILILDCGTGLQDGAVRAALRCADQLVLVSDAEPATASLVAEAGRLLGREQIPLTLVVNKMPSGGGRLDVEGLAAHLPQAAHLVVVPAEPATAAVLARGEFGWTEAPRTWQHAIRELAVALVSEWRSLGLAD